MERSRATAAKYGLPHATYSNIQLSRLLTSTQNNIGHFLLGVGASWGACVDWLQKWLHEPSLSVAVWPRGLGSDKHTNKEETWAEEKERPSQGLQHISQFSFYKKIERKNSDIPNKDILGRGYALTEVVV